MFSTFPEDAHWNTERQAVEFEVEIGDLGSSATAACSNGYCRIFWA